MAQTQVKENYYIVYDHVSAQIILSLTAANDSIAVRNSLSTLRVPLKDSELYQVAEIEKDFDNNSQTVQFGFGYKYIPVPVCHVDWSCYSFPESPAEAIAPLGSAAKIKEV